MAKTERRIGEGAIISCLKSFDFKMLHPPLLGQKKKQCGVGGEDATTQMANKI